jgi:hypothetical protein
VGPDDLYFHVEIKLEMWVAGTVPRPMTAMLPAPEGKRGKVLGGLTSLKQRKIGATVRMNVG